MRDSQFQVRRMSILVALIVCLMIGATPAHAKLDAHGGAASLDYAPYTVGRVDGTGRAVGYWEAFEQANASYAPYTEPISHQLLRQ